MIEIKSIDGKVLCSLECHSLSGANLRKADLSGADLSGADLREASLREASLRKADLSGADLRWADLRKADLSGAIISNAVGNGFEIISLQLQFNVTVCGYTAAIGCYQKAVQEWLSLSDEEIIGLDENAKQFYNDNGDIIRAFLKKHGKT